MGDWVDMCSFIIHFWVWSLVRCLAFFAVVNGKKGKLNTLMFYWDSEFKEKEGTGSQLLPHSDSLSNVAVQSKTESRDIRHRTLPLSPSPKYHYLSANPHRISIPARPQANIAVP